MDAVSVEASRQTLMDSTGNRIQLINNILQEGWSAVGDLVSEWDIFTVKDEIMGCLERVYHGLDLIIKGFIQRQRYCFLRSNMR